MTGRISLDTNIVIRLFKDDPKIIKTLVTVSTFCLPFDYTMWQRELSGLISRLQS
ncbi:MAG: hypothetical protein JETT_0583 [Candidatus Jettenia ecosi]|uniref:Uncharacterized protein n=1 Tax=Candidatus Jettenia ecosi TaxID=2494326 RepID=A0A533QEH5_9BACT|nr:MAG: hypothetical protein JETT_0583 [Candidatus Jettenia ecosi]